MEHVVDQALFVGQWHAAFAEMGVGFGVFLGLAHGQ